MKYIKQISADEINEALKKFHRCSTEEEFWEVKGFYAIDEDLCFSTTDDNCFYCFQTRIQEFVYFALNKNKIINMKGLFESLYTIVCSGYSYIRLVGRVGRYPRILKAATAWKMVEPLYPVKGREEIMWYAGHPHNVELMKRRFQK